MKIEEIDRFLREANQGLATRTCKEKESIIRGFLRYLYHEHRLLTRDISALLISAPVFNRDNPPKYLRPDEIRRLFEAVSFSSARDLRTHAIVRLAYTTGLRPLEIARITLDDISFKNGELSVPMRKGYNPVIFPLPDDSIKAIVAYILGARPETDERVLILGLEPPIRPISVYAVGNSIRCLMKKAGVPGAPYWLRHTYAQNLLESGASIFEIKEMLGHESIKTTKRYLHIHIKLMREVLLDD